MIVVMIKGAELQAIVVARVQQALKEGRMPNIPVPCIEEAFRKAMVHPCGFDSVSMEDLIGMSMHAWKENVYKYAAG